jgi:nickel-dependent lactate racemase
MKVFMENLSSEGLSNEEIFLALKQSVENQELKKVLLLPPDFTRYHSNAGLITNFYYHYFTDRNIQVDIMPALGTHDPMSESEIKKMYGDIPTDKFLIHNWREDIELVGTVPKEYISEITEGLWEEEVPCEVNKIILDPSYDLIISIGQVVPHEVIGMSNHSKNVFVGCGGKQTINQSHMIGAVYGMERMMGKDFTPVRKLLDHALEHFLTKQKIVFVLTVTTAPKGVIKTHGLYIGSERNALEAAVKASQAKNIDWLDKPIKKCVVYLDPEEFKSTWLGNKSIYRTRMAIADGGELIVLAGGVKKFGEDKRIDELIRKYGYCGRLNVLNLFKENTDLQENMGVAAHLIHSSSDERFSVTYAVKDITRSEIESVYFKSADYLEMIKKYDPEKLSYGWNMIDGEEIFFIPNPALGLWIDKKRFENTK